jgi:hypothetical protein
MGFKKLNLRNGAGAEERLINGCNVSSDVLLLSGVNIINNIALYFTITRKEDFEEMISQVRWLMPVILATQEAGIWRIAV